MKDPVAILTMGPASERPKAKCSMCRQKHPQVKYLFKGVGASNICEVCVRASNDTLAMLGLENILKKLSEGGLLDPLPEEKPKKATKALTPKEIIKHLDTLVIKQGHAKEALATALYEHLFRKDQVAKYGRKDDLINKSNILLFGPTGSGKTLLSQALAELTQLPFYCADASRITQAGYIGEDAETILKRLLQQCNYDLEKAQWGIVFLDEFDKLARKSGRESSSQRDVNGEGAQRALLKIIEGGVVPLTVELKEGKRDFLFDTSNLMFVCAGSFDGILDILSKRHNDSRARLGFGGEAKRRSHEFQESLYEELTPDDLKDFGIIEEMVGRLHVLTYTTPLSIDDLVRILVEPRNSIVKQMIHFFAAHKVTLSFSKEALQEIAQHAHRKKVGARGLASAVKKVLHPYIMDQLPGNEKLCVLHIDLDSVKTPGTSKLELRFPPPRKESV